VIWVPTLYPPCLDLLGEGRGGEKGDKEKSYFKTIGGESVERFSTGVTKKKNGKDLFANDLKGGKEEGKDGSYSASAEISVTSCTGKKKGKGFGGKDLVRMSRGVPNRFGKKALSWEEGRGNRK